MLYVILYVVYYILYGRIVYKCLVQTSRTYILQYILIYKIYIVVIYPGSLLIHTGIISHHCAPHFLRSILVTNWWSPRGVRNLPSNTRNFVHPGGKKSGNRDTLDCACIVVFFRSLLGLFYLATLRESWQSNNEFTARCQTFTALSTRTAMRIHKKKNCYMT